MPRYYNLKVIEVFKKYCICEYGIFRHKVIIKNYNFLINQHIEIYGILKIPNYKFNLNIFNFTNYFVSTSIWYELKCSNYFNLGNYNNHLSWLSNYFLYHLKIIPINVKNMQMTNIVALFILSTIHISVFKKCGNYLRIPFWLQLLIVIGILGYFSYKSNFYLITSKAFILEVIILFRYLIFSKHHNYQISNSNIASVVTILCFGPFSLLNMGLWFSIILSFAIERFWKKIKHNFKLFNYLYLQFYIYIISLSILLFFSNSVLLFNGLWMILFFPILIIFSLLLIMSNLFHIRIIDIYLSIMVENIISWIIKFNFNLKLNLEIKYIYWIFLVIWLIFSSRHRLKI